MKDRIPTYAGRIRLTPVENQPNVYDMERADEPIQEGTPLNSQNLLSNATAQMFGLDEDSTPNDAFVATSNLIKSGAKIAMGSYVGTGETSKTLTFDFDPKIVIVQQIGSGISTTATGYHGVFTAGCGQQIVFVHKTLTYEVKATFRDQSIVLTGRGDSDVEKSLAAFNSGNREYTYVAIG